MNTKTMKIIMMLLGNLLMGIAVAILRMSRFGTDPFTCMNLGVSGFLNISFGTYQLLVNIILFIFVLWKGRGCIGAGTIVNMAGIGYIADFGVFVLTKCLGQPEMLSMQIRILLMIFAVTMCSFAAAMYMEADMGIAPYDAFGVAIGFLFGSIVGVATVSTAFCMGPLIEVFRVQCMEKLIIKYGN